MRVRAATEADLSWLLGRVGFAPTPHLKGVAAVDERGLTRGCVGFDYWTGSSCQVHMASSTPIVWRALLPAALDYAFRQTRRVCCVAMVREKNAASRALVQHFGFREQARLEDGAARGEALLMFVLRPEWCPQWHAEKERGAA